MKRHNERGSWREIMKEEEDNVYDMYRQAVDEEKSWAEYLFKES